MLEGPGGLARENLPHDPQDPFKELQVSLVIFFLTKSPSFHADLYSS